jgi:hypothetical protein
MAGSHSHFEQAYAVAAIGRAWIGEQPPVPVFAIGTDRRRPIELPRRLIESEKAPLDVFKWLDLGFHNHMCPHLTQGP